MSTGPATTALTDGPLTLTAPRRSGVALRPTWALAQPKARDEMAMIFEMVFIVVSSCLVLKATGMPGRNHAKSTAYASSGVGQFDRRPVGLRMGSDTLSAWVPVRDAGRRRARARHDRVLETPARTKATAKSVVPSTTIVAGRATDRGSHEPPFSP